MQKRIILFLILLIGAWFRFYNLDWSLPDIFEEATPWKKAWSFWNFNTGELDFNPHFFNYPSFYFYIQWVGQAVIYLWGTITGKFTSIMSMKEFYISDPTPFIYLGRAITSLFGIGTIYLLYRLGKNIFSPSVGLAAALLIACNPLHIELCQLISVDVPLTFFVILSFFPIWQISKMGGLRHYILGGICVGLAAGTKYPGLLCAIGIITAHIYSRWNQQLSWKRILLYSKNLWISAACVIITFIIVSPYCVLDFHSFYEDFQFEQTHMEVGHFGTQTHFVSYGTYIFSIIPDNLTLPVAILTLIGIGYGMWKYRSKSIIILTFPFIYFLIVGSWSMSGNRYIMPIIPLLFIFPTLLLKKIIENLRMPQLSVVYAAASCLLIILPIQKILDYYPTEDTQDNRSLAKVWIEENIPKNELIAKEMYTPDLADTGYYFFELPMHILYPSSIKPFYI